MNDAVMVALHAIITALIVWVVKEVKSLAIIVARLEQRFEDKPWKLNGKE